MNALILLAGGKGRRMGDPATDKVLASVGGRPVFEYSLTAFHQSGLIDHYIIVYRDSSQKAALKDIVMKLRIPEKKYSWAAGGAERQDSVENAFPLLPPQTAYLFIHDAARPLLQTDTIEKLADMANRDGAACAARRVTDTIKEAGGPEVPRRSRLRTPERSRLWQIETPQVFERKRIVAGYREARRRNVRLTDDAAGLELIEEPVSLLELDYPNPKLTTPADLSFIAFLVEKRGQPAP